jgi:hypothetical protein
MNNYDAYIEAHERIAEIVSGMDMRDYDEVAGSERGKPADEVRDAMYSLAETHLKEAKALAAEKTMFKGVHGNLIAPPDED